MKLLEYEADFFRAIAHQLAFAELREIDAVNNHMSRCEGVEAAKNIDQRGFAGAGRAHQRDPFALVHIEAEPSTARSAPYCLVKRFSMTTSSVSGGA